MALVLVDNNTLYEIEQLGRRAIQMAGTNYGDRDAEGHACRLSEQGAGPLDHDDLDQTVSFGS